MTSWQTAAIPPPPRRDEVHVWRVRVDRPAAGSPPWTGILAPEEVARADQLRLRAHRQRFLVARGALRRLLSAYTGVPPQRLGFRYAEHGKPYLPPSVGAGLEFNLSHSGDVVLLAMAWERQVGVDVEHMSREVGWERVSQRFFASPECDALASLPEGQRLAGFFNCWTRKEAYLKARGQGLSVGLSTFAVSLDPEEPARLTWASEAEEGPDAWRLEALAPADGYAGAVCAAGQDWRLRRFELSL